LTNKKLPLATQNPYFRLSGGNAAIPAIGLGWMYFSTRPEPVTGTFAP
jgi:hypothetical protein